MLGRANDAYIDIKSKNRVFAPCTLQTGNLSLELILRSLILLTGTVIALRLLVSLLPLWRRMLLRVAGLRSSLTWSVGSILTRLRSCTRSLRVMAAYVAILFGLLSVG
jgi:hypothetical protein